MLKNKYFKVMLNAWFCWPIIFEQVYNWLIQSA